MTRYAPLAGRILLSLIFLVSGLGKIPAWDQTAAYMASRGMPVVPLFLIAAICIEVGAGLSVMLGFRAKAGATALMVFLVPATLIFHNFWTYPPAEQQVQMVMFLKNVSILGGLLLVAAFGAGPVSVDARRSRRRPVEEPL